MKAYYPLIPVAILYILLFLTGLVVDGMWQPMALLAFYGALGQVFNIFMGFTGYVDFGYVAFLALGAYGMALAISSLSESLGWWVLPTGLVTGLTMSLILSLIVGAIALRLKGAYFAIATIGVNEGLRYLIEGTGLWGGTMGIILSRPLRDTFGSDGANRLSTFWADLIVYLVALLAALITILYLRSRAGYALLAMREDEEAARVMGIDTTRYKLMAFITSASLGGLIGASGWALKMTYVFPEDVFDIIYTIEAIIIVLLGGAGTLLGPLLGGIIYASLKYWLSVTFPGLQLLLLAPVILAIIVAFPEGIVGMVKKRLRWRPLRGLGL